jgi:hypothetical protein
VPAAVAAVSESPPEAAPARAAGACGPRGSAPCRTGVGRGPPERSRGRQENFLAARTNFLAARECSRARWANSAGRRKCSARAREHFVARGKHSRRRRESYGAPRGHFKTRRVFPESVLPNFGGLTSPTAGPKNLFLHLGLLQGQAGVLHGTGTEMPCTSLIAVDRPAQEDGDGDFGHQARTDQHSGGDPPAPPDQEGDGSSGSTTVI